MTPEELDDVLHKQFLRFRESALREMQPELSVAGLDQEGAASQVDESESSAPPPESAAPGESASDLLFVTRPVRI